MSTLPMPTAEPSATHKELGSLEITTDSVLAVELRDSALRVVAEGVSPLQVKVPPGLYMATAIRPGAPNLMELVKISSGKSATVLLTDKDPTSWKKAIDTLANLAPSALRAAPQPKLQQAKAAIASPVPFHVRFFRLVDWKTAEPVQIPKISSTHEQQVSVVSVQIGTPGTLFAQIACDGRCPLNVELPPTFGSPVSARLRVSASEDDLAAKVQFGCEWANCAADYLAQGYIEQAKQLLEKEHPPNSNWKERILDWIRSRNSDPAAALVGRYIRLRLGNNNNFQSGMEGIMDAMQALSDGHIINAEIDAKAGHHKRALTRLLLIKDGKLPLFTEGFSMAVARLRQYSQQRFEVGQIDDAEAKRAAELLSHLNNWSPVADLNALTLTFTGADIANPIDTQFAVDLRSDSSWRRFDPVS